MRYEMRSFLIACLLGLSVALLGLAGCGDDPETKSKGTDDVAAGDADSDADSDADTDGDADTDPNAVGNSENPDTSGTDTAIDNETEVSSDAEISRMWRCLICDDFDY